MFTRQKDLNCCFFLTSYSQHQRLRHFPDEIRSWALSVTFTYISDIVTSSLIGGTIGKP